MEKDEDLFLVWPRRASRAARRAAHRRWCVRRRTRAPAGLAGVCSPSLREGKGEPPAMPRIDLGLGARAATWRGTDSFTALERQLSLPSSQPLSVLVAWMRPFTAQRQERCATAGDALLPIRLGSSALLIGRRCFDRDQEEVAKKLSHYPQPLR